MQQPKIVFSLVLLSSRERRHTIYFSVHDIAPVYTNRFRSTNGWTILRSPNPYINFEDREIHLAMVGDSGDCAIHEYYTVSPDIHSLLREVMMAIENWSKFCPELSREPPPESLSPEVAESLSELDTTDDCELPAPPIVEEFIPMRMMFL